MNLSILKAKKRKARDEDLPPIEDNPEDDADPWAEGAEAAEAWKSMKTNPYLAGSEQRQLWDEGYRSARAGGS